MVFILVFETRSLCLCLPALPLSAQIIGITIIPDDLPGLSINFQPLLSQCPVDGVDTRQGCVGSVWGLLGLDLKLETRALCTHGLDQSHLPLRCHSQVYLLFTRLSMMNTWVLDNPDLLVTRSPFWVSQAQLSCPLLGLFGVAVTACFRPYL